MNTMIQEELTEILRALHDGLAALLGERLEAVYLYGSQARDAAGQAVEWAEEFIQVAEDYLKRN